MGTKRSEFGVSENANVDEVKKHYRLRSQQLHPDKGGNQIEFAGMALQYKDALEEATKAEARQRAIDSQCKDCEGTGKILRCNGFESITTRCKTCRGSGKIISNKD